MSNVRIRCLLLVDDEPHEVERTRRRLTATDLHVDEVVVATSLALAITSITSRPVDIVLLDLDLGDSKGLDTLAAVRAVTDAVVIVLTVAENEMFGVSALKRGADDYLVKGEFGDECLRAAIVKSMARRAIRRTTSRIEDNLKQLVALSGA